LSLLHAEKKEPKAKKAKNSSSAASVTTNDKADKAKPKPKKQASDKAKAADKNDVSTITLPGEHNCTVPIYDTCDDIRTKINRYLATAGPSKAGFVRTVNAATSTTSAFRPASVVNLTTFLKGKGPVKGCESPIFYAAYVYFEKIRIKEGKPKTKKRVEMENVWKKTGMELFDSTVRGILTTADKRPWVDKFGMTHCG